MSAIEDLAESFCRLPGIGKKTALRLAYFCVKADPHFLQSFSREIAEIQAKVKKCPVCGCFAESEVCGFCANPLRDKTLICVVEQPQDAVTIDSFGDFRGLFHVLGGVIAPLEGVGPESLDIAPLVARAKDGAKEIVLALNPTIEGDTTSLYIQKILYSAAPNVKVTRLASGIPVGGDIEYIDRLTLARSFRSRVEV